MLGRLSLTFLYASFTKCINITSEHFVPVLMFQKILLTFICLSGGIFHMTLQAAPSDRDVGTRSSASGNVDFETRYVIICVVARVAEGVGEER
jgi:hypothetical protein